jgi:2-methylcitrate dehydratase PrpD
MRVRERASLLILDTIGVGIAGASHPIVKRIHQAVDRLKGSGSSTIIGHGTSRAVTDAVLINGTAMQVHDFDEAHLPSRTHPSVAILPAVLAMGELRRSPGRDVVLAYLVGYELETAIGRSLLPEHYARGWHSTATIGALGSAAAVANLLRLEPDAVKHAVNLAGTQAGGVRATFGGMVKHMNPGKAAMNGLLAAIWAQAGITSGADTLTHPNGFAAASTGRPARLQWRKADDWAIEQSTAKRFPCCLESHPAIELALRFRSLGFTALNLKSMTVRVYPEVLKLVGEPEPTTGMAAKFSLPHCMALALVQGTVAVPDFEQDPTSAGPVRDVRRCIELRADREFAYTECAGEAMSCDGRTISANVSHARGSPADPLSYDELCEKFLQSASPVLGTQRARELMELALRIETLPDISSLLAATRRH